MSGADWLLDLLVISTLIAINAVLAGSEMAIVSLREGQLRRMSAEGGTGAKVANLARNPNRYLSAIQLGIT
ncbi:MAG: CNNM domain-containing protein, partial [Acidimicrobiales bacterium]